MVFGKNWKKAKKSTSEVSSPLLLPMKMEEDAVLFYSYASRYVNNSKAKKLFSWLITVEKGHLSNLLFQANEPMDRVNSLGVNEDDPRYDRMMERLKSMDGKSALLFSIRDEKTAIRVYNKIKDSSKEKKIAVMFDQFVRDEVDHVYKLEQLFAQLYGRLPEDEDFKGLPAMAIPT